MTKLRFIHTADWHADSDPVRLQKLNDSLLQLTHYTVINKTNAVIIAGDIWDKKQSYTQKSGVPDIINTLRDLSNNVDYIFIVKGNNSHDEPGSISLLDQIEPNIFALETPGTFGINDDKIVNLFDNPGLDPFDYLISLVPYPTKANFINSDSIDNNNADFIQKFEEVFEMIGETVKDNPAPIHILAVHANVVGSRLSSGQSLVSQDIMVSPTTLELAKADYYALGHIHLRQEIKENMLYSGSIYNKSWGETEQKSFEVIEIEDGVLKHFPVMLESARPMAKLTAEFDAENGFPVVEEDGLYSNSDLRLRISVKESDKKLLTYEKIKAIEESYTAHGNTINIEISVIPDQRESRSEKIMTCKSLLDEVKEYAEITNQEVTTTIETKLTEFEEAIL